MGQSEFVDCIRPLGERLKHYDPKRSPTDQPDNDAIYETDPARAVPQGFIDAMIVREEVYVKEQNVPLENEFDEDDPRSFHWVAYASIPAKANTNGNGERKSSNSTKIPIGTIRLVPPPHAPHPPPSGSDSPQSTHDEPIKEPYVKLGRLAVIKEFRKAGISKLLIDTALNFAREHPHEVGPPLDPAQMEALKKGLGVSFRGLVLIHAQTGAQNIWKKYGFETDESMGEWDEEGIPHVAMWKRIDVSDARRKSKIWMGGPGPMSS
ncbi:hypothetical protein AC578_1968 [Pseudocercospora eumusae]|uniref:N-acetyltransferase domain-containing protein n=1 Tax=Pseudocercospora eumusae TaxID=321146 RepID=A0A139H269_9PEZI|nr:hypothetical protein AC578_1968 [Pseudocercospora eumusae]